MEREVYSVRTSDIEQRLAEKGYGNAVVIIAKGIEAYIISRKPATVLFFENIYITEGEETLIRQRVGKNQGTQSQRIEFFVEKTEGTEVYIGKKPSKKVK